MTTTLWSGFLLSLDSLIMSLALGPLVDSPRQRWRLAALFGICDGLAVVAGSVFGQWEYHVGQKIGALCILSYGAFILIAAHWNEFRSDPRWVCVLPLLMSLDNFAYGLGAGPSMSAVAARGVVLGSMSFALAMSGLLFWRFVPMANIRNKKSLAYCGLMIACAEQFFV